MRVHLVDPSAYTPPYDHALAQALAVAGADVELYTSHFVGYASYEKLGDSEILYSVIHIVKEVKDGRLRELFLNAAQWSKNAEEVAKMRKDALSLDRQISE